jgi:hypothetical protein
MTLVINDIRRSRRQILGDLTLAVGGAALFAAVSAARPASAKVSEQGVGYQPTPSGSARCDNCAQWQPPHGCKVVAGNISPSGWCSIYARKS